MGSRVKNERVGEKHSTNENYIATITDYINVNNCTIQLNDWNKTVLKNIQYTKLVKGNIKNPYHPSVYGKGYIGEGIHLRSINRKNTKMYDAWNGMLERCYSEKLHKKFQTYKNCEVIEEWHNFQVFCDWYEINYNEDFDVDKDILFKGNKIYSPRTCCFVPQEINKLFTKSDKSRGEYPIGVTKSGKKFQARISKSGESFHLGYYNTSEEAFQAYKIAKEGYIKFLAEKYKDQITEACYQALINYKVEITD